MHAKNDSPSLTLATLEALAILFALKAFSGGTPQASRTTVQILPTWTDNRGNWALLNKLMSTKTPIGAVLLELALRMKEMGQKTVNWTPQAAKREADSLANGNASEFDPKLEVVLEKDRLQWRVLPKALEMAHEAETAVAEAKRKGALLDLHQEAGPTTLGAAYQSDRPVVTSVEKSYRTIYASPVVRGSLWDIFLFWSVCVWWYALLSIFALHLTSSYSVASLVCLVPVEMLIRPVVLCTTHTGCMLITTVVLCMIEAGCRNGSSRSECLLQSGTTLCIHKEKVREVWRFSSGEMREMSWFSSLIAYPQNCVFWNWSQLPVV